MENNWTYEEFHAFTMLFAANADGHITTDEEELIAPRLSAEQYDAVKQRFRSCTDTQALEMILSYKDAFCATAADRDRILTDMREIYEAHNGFEQIERCVHHMFERMLS